MYGTVISIISSSWVQFRYKIPKNTYEILFYLAIIHMTVYEKITILFSIYKFLYETEWNIKARFVPLFPVAPYPNTGCQSSEAATAVDIHFSFRMYIYRIIFTYLLDVSQFLDKTHPNTTLSSSHTVLGPSHRWFQSPKLHYFTQLSLSPSLC